MQKINWNRVILGGLLAGLVVNIVEFVMNTFVVQKEWADAMKALGKSAQASTGQIVVFNVWGFMIGIAAVWLYAAIRPRYGAGPRTALCAGSATWFLAYLIAMVPPVVLELFPLRLMGAALAAGLVEMLAGTLLGASIYKEEEASAGGASSAAAGH